MYKFVVSGEPVGKGRPRFTRVGGYVRAYEPKKTKTYEELVKQSFIEQNPDYKTIPQGKSIALFVDLYYKIPKGTSKKNRELMLGNHICPTKKPDLDNVLKSICDGLNGVAWYDDSQVTTVVINKVYSNEPKATITIVTQQDWNDAIIESKEGITEEEKKEAEEGFIEWITSQQD